MRNIPEPAHSHMKMRLLDADSRSPNGKLTRDELVSFFHTHGPFLADMIDKEPLRAPSPAKAKVTTHETDKLELREPSDSFYMSQVGSRDYESYCQKVETAQLGRPDSGMGHSSQSSDSDKSEMCSVLDRINSRLDKMLNKNAENLQSVPSVGQNEGSVNVGSSASVSGRQDPEMSRVCHFCRQWKNASKTDLKKHVKRGSVKKSASKSKNRLSRRLTCAATKAATPPPRSLLPPNKFSPLQLTHSTLLLL